MTNEHEENQMIESPAQTLLDLKHQKLFDDVGKKVLLLQTMQDRDMPIEQAQLRYMREAILTLAKAVQTLRPSTSTTPIECSQQQDLEKQSEQPKILWQDARFLTHQEWELILHTRSEGLSVGKLTTYLIAWKSDLPLQQLVQNLREET